MRKVFYCLFLLVTSVFAQNVEWTDITSDYSLPSGIRVFSGHESSMPLKAWYVEVDLNVQSINIRPYYSENPMNVKDFCSSRNAIIAVNGGYFGGSQSYSTIVYPGEVVARNISSISRDGTPYPVTRGFMGMKTDRSLSVDWIYHYGNTVGDIYQFENPVSNKKGTPARAPEKTSGKLIENLWVGMGGGPVLIKNGEINITFEQEVIWGSGVAENISADRSPRSVTGYTDDNRAIFMIIDGRQDASVGATLAETARIMSDIGCVEALNMDGGGSAQLAVPDGFINTPSENRPVPSIWAVVPVESLKNVESGQGTSYEKIIDSGDTDHFIAEGNWFPTANEGFWGTTASLLNDRGDGSETATFNLYVEESETYDVYGWWVAAFNRCKDTPFIIVHRDGTDTVAMDQTINHAQWAYIGTYRFSGANSEKIIITDGATEGDYAVADAVRLVVKDGSPAAENKEYVFGIKNHFLSTSYPNPFRISTRIPFQLQKSGIVDISVYNITGEKIDEIVQSEYFGSGKHEIDWKPELGITPSGMYFVKFEFDNESSVSRTVLIK